MISLENVGKTYYSNSEENVPVLNGVNLTIEQGDFVSIIGHSGSGKSTLLNILGCLDRPSCGRYFLNGSDVTELTDREISKIRGETIGFVFQNFNLLKKRTVFDNLTIPLIYHVKDKSERIKRVEETLEWVNMTGYDNRLPSQLSGGQQQRIAIARALVNKPKILLADEPTGNLDFNNGKAILEIFKELNTQHNITIIMVTHDKDVARQAQRYIKIGDGKIIYDGKVFIWF